MLTIFGHHLFNNFTNIFVLYVLKFIVVYIMSIYTFMVKDVSEFLIEESTME